MRKNHARFYSESKLRAPGLPLADSLHTTKYDRQSLANLSFAYVWYSISTAGDVSRCHPSYSERSSSRFTNVADGSWAQLICATPWPYRRTSRPTLELSSSGCPQPDHLIHACWRHAVAGPSIRQSLFSSFRLYSQVSKVFWHLFLSSSEAAQNLHWYSDLSTSLFPPYFSYFERSHFEICLLCSCYSGQMLIWVFWVLLCHEIKWLVP